MEIAQQLDRDARIRQVASVNGEDYSLSSFSGEICVCSRAFKVTVLRMRQALPSDACASSQLIESCMQG